jgi:hypothetical protein
MILSKVISSEIANLGRRIVKLLVNGRSDVRTARQAGPYGIDSNPVKGMTAIYSATGVAGKAVVIGYLNVNQLAGLGELRAYSTDAGGELKTYLWLKNDGTMELGGNAKNLARFQELEDGFNQLRSDHNDLVNALNTHMHPTAATGPPSVPTGAGIPAAQSMADISGAKIEEIKTL